MLKKLKFQINIILIIYILMVNSKMSEDTKNGNHNIIRKYANQLYCLSCEDYTKHRVKNKDHILCVACSNLRPYITVYDPDEKEKIDNLTCICIISKLNDAKINNICLICNKNKVKYYNAYFTCNIQGINNMCLDINRPLCSDCHNKMCINKTHEICGNDNIKEYIIINKNAKL